MFYQQRKKKSENRKLKIGQENEEVIKKQNENVTEN